MSIFALKFEHIVNIQKQLFISIMKKLNLWMIAAILTFCGTTTTLTSCVEKDDPVKPEQPTERTSFETQLSTTLSNAVQHQNLQPTLQAAQVLTGFIEQLNIGALAPQFGTIMTNVLVNTKPINFADLGDQEAEAREALKNTFSALADAPMFSVTSAEKVLGKTRLTFVEGVPEMKYETGVGTGLVIAYENPTAKMGTELTFEFNNPNDGVIMFIAKLSNVPMAIQFPANISFTIKQTLNGVQTETMSGVVALTAAKGKKYISLKGSEWEAAVATKAATADRFEVPMAFMHHYADGRVDGEAGLMINGTTVLDVAIKSSGIPYNDAEMEQLKALREKGSFYAGFYEVLRMFNSRSGKAQLTVMEDLVFDVDVKDIAVAAGALGTAIQLRRSHPAKADIDPLSEQLDKALSFTVAQRSTGVTAEGKIVTANIEGVFQPALALRFNGESDFKVMYDAMSEADRANYQALLKSFDAPARQLEKIFKAFDEKRKDFEKLNPFKGL